LSLLQEMNEQHRFPKKSKPIFWMEEAPEKVVFDGPYHNNADH